jgi:hypothetical protein
MDVLKFSALELFCLVSLVAQSQGPQKTFPAFSEYPSASISIIKKAPLKLTKQDMLYKTRLRSGYSQPINYAGKYILTLWGCGAECLMGAVIDTETGYVHWLPGTVCCWNDYDAEDQHEIEPIEFKVDSNLIIFRGLINEKGLNATHYYQISNGKFKRLATGPLPHAR